AASLADANQVRLAAVVEMIVGDGRAGHHLLAEHIFGQELESRRRGEHVEFAFLVGGVDVAVDQHRRGGEIAAEVFTPDLFARLAVVANGLLFVLDPVEVTPRKQEGWHVGQFLRVPGEVRPGDVALAAYLHGDRLSVPLAVTAVGKDQAVAADGRGDTPTGRPE